ncbi:multicopper oxidase family protein [Allobranchiibius sp. CTAmp26]|uniref:multicopper oxidase family protein n=1 Tax=Allobranchiibius sp. CTAmp26 TaxID=2815214 RepID=UPI001FB7E5C5|nr:multicopper oxidase family protein [Allobranchiibius sp. CTAmp26]
MSTRIGGAPVQTWGYNRGLPGPLLRSRVGDTLAVAQHNGLPEATSMHFHGLALRNDMDGVPALTQAATAPGAAFTATFKTAHPGTYWYHSHMELQRDRALYGPLIVDDPHEPLPYDAEWVVLLDDWLDGIDGRTPAIQAATLSKGMGSTGSGRSGMSGMSGMSGGGSSTASPFLGSDGGDVNYPLHLVNGRDPLDPEVFRAKAGQRVRIRLINSAGDTAYRVGIPGVRLTVTHTDGFPVVHQEVDALVLGMGERFDVLVTVPDHPVPLTVLAEGKTGRTFAILDAGRGRRPTAASVPTRLGGKVIGARMTAADPSVRLAPKEADVTHTLAMTGSMSRYDWGINGRRYDESDPFASAVDIRAGHRVRLDFANRTMMWHPMHLHGHTFQVGATGPRKDTVVVKPMETVSVFFDADNPGQWLTHCHNAYHAARGMMAVVSYVQ